MHFPDFLDLYRKKAEKLLPKVGHIEFSGETYQIQISDPHFTEDVWAFLQLELSGDFKDGFCSCEETEDVSRCVHLATAYLRVYNDTSLPLHQRFKQSLWNIICFHFADKLGYETDLLTEHGSGSYSIQSIFQLKGKTKEAKEFLENFLYHRHSETEETSLKFSNLSQEEIQLWKEGRPSPALRYELSFWNDLAKWLMLLQDSEASYTIKFEYGQSKLPHAIAIQFKEVELRFSLEKEDLIAMIPSLATVESPLAVHTMNEETIEKIRYDEKSRTLEVQTNMKEAFDRSSAVPLGGWMFVPEEGFFAVEAQGVLFQGELQGESIGKALDQYSALIASKLKGTKVHPDPTPVHYEVHFDESWNLHIEAYLFEKGDLKKAPQFGAWVYLKGFYRTEGLRFNSASIIIPPHDVGDFVTKHRAWLANFPGLETHLATIEGQLTYSVSPENHLSFAGHFQNPHEIVRTKDFGTWIFIEGQGFYSKVGTITGMPLRPGIALDKEQVAPFIRLNREELKYVPRFFSDVCPIAKAGLTISLTDDEQVWVQPHYESEDAYKNKTIRFFDDFTYVADEGFHQLPAGKQLPVPFIEPVYLSDDEIPPFVSQEIPRFQERYSIVIDPRLRVPEELYLVIGSASPKEKGWYSLKLAYKTEYGSIPITDIWEAMHAKKRFFFHEAGLLDLHHSRYHWIRKIPKNRIDKRSSAITLSTMDVVRLSVFDEIRVDAKKEKEQQEATEFLEALQKFEMPQAPDLTGLKSDLRPYQKVGVQWLWFLYNHNLSGLLCDDMGLGKTHQAMALMTAIRNEGQEKHDPFVVVCPTSVIYHWEDKLKEYLPGMKVCTFYGSKRVIPEHYDILLTSYGVWRMESSTLKKIPFSLAILDEIQMAKNENSRLHASLLSLDARMKLGLTGTPIENDLEELKALFDITLPNYMPGPTEFRDLFVKPIEREKDQNRRQLLSRFIKPFILRRKKSEVLTDLPEKTEEVYHCGLLPEQEVLYNEVLNQTRRHLMQELTNDQAPIPYIHIFAILSSLKQICDHPAVYLKRPEFYKEHRSGKWDLFLELLSEARESKQKVVVYSQYLNMLDIIEEYLNESSIGYATIRGATTRRGEQLKKFNEDPNCEVFVGSLQASGLGVDLTAASVVIHYDRWWNAARENQATDRVHRIGQQRGVQVFKLVTKGTFEERIDQLITSKGQLMEDVVGTDDQHAIKRLNRDEILELLKFTGS